MGEGAVRNSTKKFVPSTHSPNLLDNSLFFVNIFYNEVGNKSAFINNLRNVVYPVR